MAILAFDTTLDVCSVALLSGSGDRIFAERHVPMSRGHAESLHVLIGEAMEDAALGFGDLTQIAVTTGPGTFTGSRIGVAAARGFALTLDVPVIGISTLQAMACNVESANTSIMAALDAKRGQLYAALYDTNISEILPAQAVNLENVGEIAPLDPFTVIGSGAALVSNIVPHAKQFLGDALPRASVWGRLAAEMPAPKSLPLPLYLRPPDAKPPSENSRVKRMQQ
ncbi:MAG: tRNA (adenosine(37)-N6)-threonylcarbamoyltransferase complex dimerization subunit type 1 TsaB [Hyphomicrobiales bacterium]